MTNDTDKKPDWKSLEEARAFVAPMKRAACGGFKIWTAIVGETVADAKVVFQGGHYGEHSLLLDMSSKERIQAHFEGYASQNKVLAPRVGERVTFWASNVLRTAKVLKATKKRVYVTFNFKHGGESKRWMRTGDVTLFKFVTFDGQFAGQAEAVS
jgi:hypothetical protein